MKLEYPVVITKEKNDYIVFIPDLKINTFGKTFNDAISMAYDAIGNVYLSREDNRLKIAKPSKISVISNQKQYKSNIVTSVVIDPVVFRQKNDTKAVRRNVTLPNWVDKIIRKNKLNVSEFLKNAIIKEYNLKFA